MNENRTALEQHLALYELHRKDHNAFYQYAKSHIVETLPLIYTPTIGDAIERYNDLFDQPQSLIIAYEDQNRIDELLAQYDENKIDLIIVTDGEGILGIGDQGANGHLICIGKGMVYSLASPIKDEQILAIGLDVGTNNETLLNHPNYFGKKHPRISEEQYDTFIHKFIAAIQKKFSHVVLHWEDFGKRNAQHNLHRYQTTLPSFNDDIQGTGVVTLGALLVALKRLNKKLSDANVVLFGSGSAGLGIAHQIVEAMKEEGISASAAQEKLFLLGRNGLLRKGMNKLLEEQLPYAKDQPNEMDLKAVIKKFKPQILIGCSTSAGAFDEEVIRFMSDINEHPIIFPLSNPTKKAEAQPSDIIKWSDGRAIIATGSPFQPVEYHNKQFIISQCNNAYVFPAIGLLAIKAKLKTIDDALLTAISHALASYMPNTNDITAPLLPPLTELEKVTDFIVKKLA